jgi:hypothetical protein
MSDDSRSREPAPRIPSYRRHKPTGQVVVTLNGRDIYLGKWNNKASRAEYDRLIGEWLAANRSLPSAAFVATVAELAAAYLSFAKRYSRKDGHPTAHLHAIRQALRALKEGYALHPANDFGPLALHAVQEKLIAAGNTRCYINQLCGIIKRMFRWAASQKLLPVTAYQALATVPGLRKGRTGARETLPVPPVADGIVEATLPNLSAPAGA